MIRIAALILVFVVSAAISSIALAQCYVDPADVANACQPTEGVSVTLTAIYPVCPHPHEDYACVRCDFSFPDPADNFYGYSGVGLLCDTDPPGFPLQFVVPPIQRPACKPGSIIEVDTATVRESIPIAGTPFSLNYSSGRVLGRKIDRKKKIPVFPGSTCGNIITTRKIELTVAGRTFTTTHICNPGFSFDFLWDGLDANSLPARHSQILSLQATDDHSIPLHVRSVVRKAIIGSFYAESAGLGGWTLSVNHSYDLNLKTTFRGDGTNTAGILGPNREVASEDGSEIYIFDQDGKHLLTKNSLKGTTKYLFAYDSGNRLTSVTDGFGNVTNLNYDSNQKLSSIVGPYGHVTLTTVNSSGYLSSVTNPNSEAHSMSYSSDGLLGTFENPAGVVSTLLYDSDGRLILDSSSAGSGTFLQLDGLDQIFSVSSSSVGGVSTAHAITAGQYEYTRIDSGPGYLTNRVRMQPGFSGSGFVSSTNQVGFGRDISYAADPRIPFAQYKASDIAGTPNYLRSESIVRSATISNPADPFSVVDIVETSTLNGSKVRSVAYSGANSKFTHSSALNRKSYSTIDSHERLTSLKHSTYTPTEFFYNSQGRLSSVAEGAGRTTTFVYDASGNIQSVVDALGQTSSFTYDNIGRILTETTPDLRTTTYTYDQNGNVASITPPNGFTHTFVSNGFDLIAKYSSPAITFFAEKIPLAIIENRTKAFLNSVIRWFAELVGQFSSRYRSKVTSFTVNLDTYYGYDVDKKLTSIVRPNGATAEFVYEGTTGRLSSIVTSAGNYTVNQNLGYAYVDSVVSPDSVTQTYSYEGPFLLSALNSGAVGGSVYFTYNNEFQLASTKVNTAAAVSYAYDNDGLMTAAGNQPITRNAATGFATKTTLSTASENYTYSSTFGELSSIQGKYSTATNIYLASYTRDALARISKKIETIGAGSANTYDYSYDSAGRLTAILKNSSAHASYAYDANSNRTSITRGGVTTASTFDEQDRIVTFGTKTYTHNDAGEMTQVSDAAVIPAAVTSYTYDVFGNIKSVTLPGSMTIAYVLDGQHRRVGRKVSGIMQKQFVWFDSQRLGGELDGSGTLVSQFIYGLKGNVPDYMIKGGVRYKIMTDHLGSVMAVVHSTTGVIAQAITYDEFGKVLSDTAPGFQPFGFAGGMYDSDTKLTLFGARSYDAETGRWLSKDPILFGGGDTNLYGYAMKDPVNFVDPSGLAKCSFSLSTGKLSCSSNDGKQTVALAAISGGEKGGPLPMGRYDIRRAAGQSGGNWYLDPGLTSRGLYRASESLKEYIGKGFWRGAFNLHLPGTRSDGCIVAPRSSTSVDDLTSLNTLLTNESGNNVLDVIN